MTAKIAQLENYLDSFTAFTKKNAPDSPRWLGELRDAAFARFCTAGFPTTHDEDWRFTNLAGVARTPFQLARESTARFTAAECSLWHMQGAAAELVFVDGSFMPHLSTWGPLPDRVTVSSLRKAIADQPQAVAGHLGRYLDTERDALSALNSAFIQDGAYVQIGRGVVVEQPIHLCYISSSSATPTMTHPRNLIVVDDEGQASIVEEYISIGAESVALSNSATELVVGSSATAVHTMIEREGRQTNNFSTLRIEQARSSNVISHSLLLGGGLVRNNVHPVLAGEGSECLINGLFIGGGQQHLDNYMLVEHRRPHCASRQFYNGILDGHSHGVFHGRIIVHQDAQKTDAKQTNRNLLLSDDAQIDTKPQLEIYADDVKCTHGATIGQIEGDALFYLRSRGISEVDARQLLLQAFAGECLDRIQPGTLRDYAATVVEERLLLLNHAEPAADAAGQRGRERNGQEAG